MVIANIHRAKTNLSQLINDAVNGKEVIIAKAGKPVATLTKYQFKQTSRKPGILKGKIFVPDDFNSEDSEVNQLFYG